MGTNNRKYVLFRQEHGPVNSVISSVCRALKGLPTKRTKPVFLFKRPAATGAAARLVFRPCPYLPGLGGNIATTLAPQKRSAFLNPKNRQEKDRDIVIDLLQTRLVKAAGRTHPWLIIQGSRFRLNSGDNKKHGYIRILSCQFIFETTANQDPS
mgnify:CR=1 FL=1